MRENQIPQTFQVGETYTTGEARDYVWHFKVLKRSAKFITVLDVSHGLEGGNVKRVGVSEGWKGGEMALPLGRYSMAPTINAEDVVEVKVDVGNDDTIGTAGDENYDELDPYTEDELAELRSARFRGCPGADALHLAAEVATEEAARQANAIEVARLAELVGAGR